MKTKQKNNYYIKYIIYNNILIKFLLFEKDWNIFMEDKKKPIVVFVLGGSFFEVHCQIPL